MDSPVRHLLYPGAETYPEDVIRGAALSIKQRMASPRSVSLVVCEASKPDIPLACGQFTRLGKDEKAKALIRSKGVLTRAYLWLWGWWLYLFESKIGFWIWPDRASNKAVLKQFDEGKKEDDKKYWDVDGRRERWHCQSVTVDPDWQGKGLGSMLMREVMELGRKDGVPVGLEASVAGEKLYRKLGFEWLGDFSRRLEGIEGGGLMLWNGKAN